MEVGYNIRLHALAGKWWEAYVNLKMESVTAISPWSRFCKFLCLVYVPTLVKAFPRRAQNAAHLSATQDARIDLEE